MSESSPVPGQASSGMWAQHSELCAAAVAKIEAVRQTSQHVRLALASYRLKDLSPMSPSASACRAPDMSTTARETSSKVGSSREVDAAISSPLLSSRLVALGGSVKRQRALDVSAYTTRTRLPISTRKQNGGQSELDKCLERVKAQAVVSAARCAAVTADLRQQQAALREAVLAKAEAVTSHADQHVTQQSSDHTVAAPTEHSDELEALTHTGSAHADAYIAGRENDGDHTDPEMRDDDTLPAASSMQEESASIPPHDAEHGVEDDSTPASKHALLHYSAASGLYLPPTPTSGGTIRSNCGAHRRHATFDQQRYDSIRATVRAFNGIHKAAGYVPIEKLLNPREATLTAEQRFRRSLTHRHLAVLSGRSSGSQDVQI